MPHHHGQPTDPLDPEEQPIIPGRIVVDVNDVTGAQEALPGLSEMTPDGLFDCSFEQRPRGEDYSSFENVFETTKYLRLPGATNEETLEAVDRLQDQGIDARPMFYCYPFNHWSAQPGVKREPTDRVPLSAQAHVPFGSGWRVWAVDSGYDDRNPWAQPGEPLHNHIDVDAPGGDPDQVAHGTFVASLIGAMSPGSKITVLKTDFSHVGGKSDELAVGVKLSTAISAFEAYQMDDRDARAVINLSLGTYVASTRSGGQYVPLTLEKQLARAAQHPDLTLVAAGGNEWSHGRKGEVAYPASDPRAIAVGAGNSRKHMDQLDWVQWIGEDKEQWIYRPLSAGLHLAPGCDLVAPSGPDFSQWSGSSFAAALQSGYLAATNGTVPAETKQAFHQLIGAPPGDTIIP